MKFVAWNVNSLRKRLPRVLAWLAATKPDVVCLQETKCVDAQFPTAALEEAGYVSAFHGQKSYNGVALLTPEPVTDVRRGFEDGAPDPAARLLAGTFRGVRVISAYAPNGQAVGSEAFAEKLRWYDRLRGSLVAELERYPLLAIAGDFNIAPADADIHDPALWAGGVMCSAAEREALGRLLALGLRDTLRLHHSESGLFSWWDYRMLAFPKNRGLRIDLILASPALAKRCTAAGIDRDARKGPEPSDHAPVWIETTG